MTSSGLFFHILTYLKSINTCGDVKQKKLSARLTTGFFLDSRMQLAYNYNFSEIRKDGRGGHEIVLHFSRDF